MYSLLKRNGDKFKEYDVIICGGGPAGFSAAIQAGRMGCRTALVEKYGMLGGAMTLGGSDSSVLACPCQDRADWSMVSICFRLRRSEGG